MDKARRRFSNLQQELSTVSPSEKKYKVMTLSECWHEFKYLMEFLLSLQEIQNQIILEYKENNNNSSFKDKKQK